MNIVKPDITKFLAPPSVREVNIAEHQDEYLTLPALVTTDGRVVSQWMPTPGELALLNEGVPITLTIFTFGRPLQPQSVSVGGTNLW
jgi:hypothetical protein